MDRIDPKSAALVIQDLQNDVIIEGGAFAESGALRMRPRRTSSRT